MFLQVVRILLNGGARVNICDRSGKTPYDLARSKLLLMRSRLDSGITPESAKLFVEMSMLTGKCVTKFSVCCTNFKFVFFRFVVQDVDPTT